MLLFSLDQSQDGLLHFANGLHGRCLHLVTCPPRHLLCHLAHVVVVQVRLFVLEHPATPECCWRIKFDADLEAITVGGTRFGAAATDHRHVGTEGETVDEEQVDHLLDSTDENVCAWSAVRFDFGNGSSAVTEGLLETIKDQRPHPASMLWHQFIVGDGRITFHNHRVDARRLPFSLLHRLLLYEDHGRVLRHFAVYGYVLSERNEIEVVRVREIALFHESRTEEV
mmetsp:Transcript_14469/g.39873  ORF Transcript_14469/g.39873 Transcript_14469/m.39873 type:complete len:226 (+) Transcript_14469:61-738(+)